VWLMVDYTGDKNIIGAPIIRFFFGALSKWLFLNIAKAILDFSQLLSILQYQKLSLLTPLLHFLYWVCTLIHVFFSVLLPHKVIALLTTSTL
jgi:hypothetical protein